MARSGFRSFPANGPKDGRGARICDASGFLRASDDRVRDRRQGIVSRDHADITPGFGTFHPQDVRRTPLTSDPAPIRDARPDDTGLAMSARDMGYSDAEVEASIRNNQPLKRRW